MKEFSIPSGNRLPHVTDFNADEILVNAYRLLSLFLADREISMLIEDADLILEQKGNAGNEKSIIYGRFTSFLTFFRQREIHRSLLNVAIACRALMDFLKTTSNTHVGAFLNDSSSSLTFREACNKIIHSSAVSYLVSDNADLKGVHPPHLEPYLRLEGELNGSRWHIEVDIKLFCAAAISVTTQDPKLFE